MGHSSYAAEFPCGAGVHVASGITNRPCQPHRLPHAKRKLLQPTDPASVAPYQIQLVVLAGQTFCCLQLYHAIFLSSRCEFPLPFFARRPLSRGRSTWPVCERRERATSSGVPAITTRPPCSPPSGPRSIM